MPDDPSPNDFLAAETKAAARALSLFLRLHTKSSVRLQLEGARKAEAVILPRAAIELLVELLVQIADGHSVEVVPVQAEITTQQAADMLNVSRPYLVRLLEEGKIPCRKVGPRRRIRRADVLTYKQIDEERRRRAAEELASEAEKLGLGY